LAGAVLFLSHYHYTWIAAVLVLIPSLITWLRGGRTQEALLAASPGAVIGLSIVVLVGLSRSAGQAVFPVVSQIALTILYGVWLVWLRQLRLHHRTSVFVLAVQQITAISAIFLAAAFWHWGKSMVIALIWIAAAGTTYWYLKVVGERAAAIMAAAWALVAAEISWVLYAWQVNYIIGDGAIIIPQIALVILGVGYCFGSIYHAHSGKRLSRRRLIEYVAISAAILAIVIAGTRWSGAV
jgi:hypothetical protein